LAFKGSKIRSDIPENHRPPGSINAALHELPVLQRRLANGTLAYLPRMGIVVVLLENAADGMRGVVVVGRGMFPRGGYDIHVSNWEVQRAVVIPDEMITLPDDALAKVVPEFEEATSEACPSLFLYGPGLYACRTAGRHQWHARPSLSGTGEITWQDSEAVLSPWPKDQEPPAGINVMMMQGGEHRIYLHRTTNGWNWSHSPDRAADHGPSARSTWTERMINTPDDDIFVYPPTSFRGDA